MWTDSNIRWGARGTFHPYAPTDFIDLMCLRGKYSALSDWVSSRGNIPFHGEPTWKYSVPWEPMTEIILLLGSLRGNDSTPWESTWRIFCPRRWFPLLSTNPRPRKSLRSS
jgi:hypothetical protein